MNRLILAMMTALVLAGCGQTGPLYMPDNQQARDRYDPQGDYGSQDDREQEDTQQGNAQPNSAQQNDARQNDNAEGQSAVSVPEAGSSPETTTAGTVGGAASTGAPAAPAQGGT